MFRYVSLSLSQMRLKVFIPQHQILFESKYLTVHGDYVKSTSIWNKGFLLNRYARSRCCDVTQCFKKRHLPWDLRLARGEMHKAAVSNDWRDTIALNIAMDAYREIDWLNIARNRGHFAPAFIGQRSMLYCSGIKTKCRRGLRRLIKGETNSIQNTEWFKFCRSSLWRNKQKKKNFEQISWYF